jgi:ribosome-associated toxin RatA of RatAB toxin-antitoxin module
MPELSLEIMVAAPVDRVWDAVRNIKSYPQLMEQVLKVEVLSESKDGIRISAWSVLLEDSVLEWTEQEQIDHALRSVQFDQLDGDLDTFSGAWSVQERDHDRTLIKLDVRFEIGIPLLAELLNPVAAQALRDNFEYMLRKIERWSVRSP